VHLADFVRFSSVVQDALGGSGLSGVNVGHNSNIAVKAQVNFSVSGGDEVLFHGGGHLEALFSITRWSGEKGFVARREG